MQGGLGLSAQYLAGADSSLTGACDLVALSTAAAQEDQLLIEDLSALLEVPLTDTSLLALLSRCTELTNVNDASFEGPTAASQGSMMQHIAAGEPLVNITKVVFLNRGATPSRPRQLLAAGRSNIHGSYLIVSHLGYWGSAAFWLGYGHMWAHVMRGVGGRGWCR